MASPNLLILRYIISVGSVFVLDLLSYFVTLNT